MGVIAGAACAVPDLGGGVFLRLSLHRTLTGADSILVTGVDGVVSVSSLNLASSRPPEASAGQPHVSNQAARQPGTGARCGCG